MNLAPIRYARILSRDRGPIERIEYGRVTVCGREMYQAGAFLSPWLNLKRQTLALFGTADGSGTHRSAMMARFMAVSEALERWALYYLNQAGLHGLADLKRDYTSTGMAAFPGLWDGQARRRALAEAAERFCLVHWWHGDLATQRYAGATADVDAVEIENPVSRDHVLLTWSRSRDGLVAYGFGAGRRTQQAYWKAVVEMERCKAALDAFYLKNPGFTTEDLSTLQNHQERRIMYFALPEGHHAFRIRLNQRPHERMRIRNIRPTVDRRIDGPWSQYATVWRVLFPMATGEYLDEGQNFFYW